MKDGEERKETNLELLHVGEDVPDVLVDHHRIVVVLSVQVLPSLVLGWFRIGDFLSESGLESLTRLDLDLHPPRDRLRNLSLERARRPRPFGRDSDGVVVDFLVVVVEMILESFALDGRGGSDAISGDGSVGGGTTSTVGVGGGSGVGDGC